MFDWARDPLPAPVPLRAEVPPAVDPELPVPRLAELDPCDGLWVKPELPSGQSALEPRELPPLPVVPLRPELVPALLPIGDDPEPMEPAPEPLPAAPPVALLPDEDPPEPEALPLVCDQPG